MNGPAGVSSTDAGETGDGTIAFLRGRFEARFGSEDSARAAARDARAVGFVVDVRDDDHDWLIVGRRQQAFPSDERDRYANRLHVIATRHSGAFSRFVDEPL